MAAARVEVVAGAAARVEVVAGGEGDRESGHLFANYVN